MPSRVEGLDDLLALAAVATGFDAASIDLPEHPARREHGPFAQHVLATGEPLDVDDALADPRFAGLPVVRDGGVRAVVARPLLRHGTVAGALIATAEEPRELTDAQRAVVDALGPHVVAHVDRAVAETRARALLERSSLILCTIDRTARIRSISDALASLLGEETEAAVGAPARLLVAAEGRPAFDEWLAGALATPGRQPAHFAPIGGDRFVELMAGNFVGDADIEALVVAVRDITARRAEVIINHAQQAITAAAHGADGLDNAAALVLAELGERTGFAGGSLFVADRARRTYSVTPARWADDPVTLAPFLDATIARPITIDIGVPGAVFRTGQPVWLEDMTADPSFLRGLLAERVGLRTVVAVPIVIDGDVNAVLEVYDRRARPLDEQLLGLLTTAADQLGRVAERERARDAVAASEARLRRVLDTAHDAFIAIDQWGLVTAWNVQAERTFGWTCEEAIGQPLEQLVIPDEHRAAHRIGLAKAAATGESVLIGRSVEMEAVAKDGHRLPVEITLWSVHDGTQWTFNAFARDISERVAREAALRANDARLRAAHDIAQIGSWEWDIRRDLITWSDGLYAMFGVERASFDPTFAAYLRTIHPDDRDQVQATVARALDTGEPFEVHHRTAMPDGGIRHIHGRGEVLHDDAGEPVMMRGVARDITEAVVAGERLEASEARFRTLAAMAPTGIYVTDANIEPIYVNERWQEIAGLTEAEVFAGGFKEMVHVDDIPAVVARWNGLVDNGTEFDVRFRIVRPNGTVRWVHGAAVELVVDGVRTGFVGAMTDITDLIEASQLKSAFLANMSHEIRTPMNAVLGLASLLLDAGLPAAQHEQVVGLRTAASNLLRIIDDILDFSKVEAGHLEISAEPTDLAAVVGGVLSLFAHRAERAGIGLDVEWGDGVPTHVIADPVRLRQILTNLVGNAVKFTTAGSVRIRVDADPGGVRFEVRDTGIGIEPTVIDRLFDPFSQADTSTTRRFGGTGLGLAICHQLVELMGGEVGVDSELGRGSQFWFVLPLEACDPFGTGDEEVEAPVAQPGRVLLAEDNELNQLVARTMLERIGFEVVVVGDGVAAVEAVREGGFDVVLMDCQMPVLDGYDATREIRRIERGRQHTPVIAMTAAAMAGDRERCLAAGMDDYVAKPVSMEALVAALDRCARRVPEPAAPKVNGGLAAALPPEVFQQITATFLSSTRERIEALHAAVETGDLEALARVAHSAKGSSSTFGADELARVAAELEKTSVGGDLEAARQLVASFAEGFVAVEAELVGGGAGVGRT